MEFPAMTGVFFDRNQQVRRSAIVQKEHALPNAPKRCGSECIGARTALDNAISQFRSHVMQQQIRVERSVAPVQSGKIGLASGTQRGCMAERTTHALKQAAA